MDSVYQPHRVGLFKAITDRMKPKRKTTGSAGYDFVAPETIEIPAHSHVRFDTGVRVEMKEGFVLFLLIRSSLGSKGLTITNSVGVIDSDFGDTMQAFITNNSDEPYTIYKGESYMQGVFLKYYITVDDNATAKRKGGIGSTGK